MRLEYSFELSDVEVPCFAVESIEGIGKLFTLATLALNVLATKDRIEIVFHGLNKGDPEVKIAAFQEIVRGSHYARELHYEFGTGGHITGSSSYYQWVTVRAGA
jgi:hypothetical protein